MEYAIIFILALIIFIVGRMFFFMFLYKGMKEEEYREDGAQERELINNVFYKKTINSILFLLYSNLIVILIHSLFIMYQYILADLSLSIDTLTIFNIHSTDNIFSLFLMCFNLGIGVAIGYFCVRSKMEILRHAAQSKFCHVFLAIVCFAMILEVIYEGINQRTLLLIARSMLWLFSLFILHRCKNYYHSGKNSYHFALAFLFVYIDTF